jgi:hypothetical protein
VLPTLPLAIPVMPATIISPYRPHRSRHSFGVETESLIGFRETADSDWNFGKAAPNSKKERRQKKARFAPLISAPRVSS